jgi:hypothetical protein
MSILDSFLIVAKDQEVADALIQLKGCKNSKFFNCYCVYSDLYVVYDYFVLYVDHFFPLIPVQDNLTPDVCKAVRSDLLKLRTYRMEFDIGIVS